MCATGADFPSWAYPVDPPPNRCAQAKDDGTRFHVPDSQVALTRTEIEARDTVADWHPEDHPPMPDIVKKGQEGARLRLLPSAQWRGPAGTTALAGLPENYIKQEVMNFKNGSKAPSPIALCRNR
jgi:hypothetical protein